MPQLPPLIEQHFWLLAVVVAVLNAGFAGWRAGQTDPATRLPTAIAAALGLGLPFLVMGLGIYAGGVAGLSAYLQPREGGPWVHAFFGAVVTVWVVSLIWVFAGGGDQTLARLKLIRLRTPFGSEPLENPLHIRAFLVVCVLGGACGLGALWLGALSPR